MPKKEIKRIEWEGKKCQQKSENYTSGFFWIVVNCDMSEEFDEVAAGLILLLSSEFVVLLNGDGDKLFDFRSSAKIFQTDCLE